MRDSGRLGCDAPVRGRALVRCLFGSPSLRVGRSMRGIRYCSTGVTVAGLARPEWGWNRRARVRPRRGWPHRHHEPRVMIDTATASGRGSLASTSPISRLRLRKGRKRTSRFLEGSTRPVSVHVSCRQPKRGQDANARVDASRSRQSWASSIGCRRSDCVTEWNDVPCPNRNRAAPSTTSCDAESSCDYDMTTPHASSEPLFWTVLVVATSNAVHRASTGHRAAVRPL